MAILSGSQRSRSLQKYGRFFVWILLKEHVLPDIELCGYFAFEKDGKWGFADYKGNVVIEPQYEEAKAFSNGYAGVKKDGKWGFINAENQFQMEGDYQDVLYFTKDKTCFVKENDLWTIIKKLI